MTPQQRAVAFGFDAGPVDPSDRNLDVDATLLLVEVLMELLAVLQMWANPTMIVPERDG